MGRAAGGIQEEKKKRLGGDIRRDRRRRTKPAETGRSCPLRRCRARQPAAWGGWGSPGSCVGALRLGQVPGPDVCRKPARQDLTKECCELRCQPVGCCELLAVRSCSGTARRGLQWSTTYQGRVFSGVAAPLPHQLALLAPSQQQ